MSGEVGGIMSSSDLEGRVIQGYKLLHLVGKGGMAWVYKAEHEKFGDKMAVKILLPHLSDDEDIRRRFLEEAKIQFKLRHPNIIQVSDIIESGRIFGFVMEWADGKNLKQVVSGLEKPVSRKDMWRIMLPVLDAVGYAHQQGLVHRDIKPANILLHQDDGVIVPKIADFGIAKALDDGEEKTATGMTMGTLKFMPPEQIMDAKRVDHRADVYALGVTLYMMATLRLPFEGRQEFVIYQQMNEVPPPPSSHNSGLPATFDRVMRKALAKKPEDRFQSCAEFGHALSLALIDPDAISVGVEELDTTKIFELLQHLPEENSVYQTTLTPLSPNLVQELYSSHTSDTITKLHKFVLEGDPESDSLAGQQPRAVLSTEELGGETILGPSAIPSSSSGGNKTGLIIGLVVALLALGGGGFYFLGMGKNNTSPQARKRPVASACQTGATRPCYPKGASGKGVGLCKSGQQTCTNGAWGSCQGAVTPGKETCDGKDNDCNGKVDDNIKLASKSCQTTIGTCKIAGTQSCSSGKLTCQAPSGDTKPKKGQLWVHLSPKASFQVRVRVKKWSDQSASHKTCFDVGTSSRRRRIQIKGKRYFRCSFSVRSKVKEVWVKMRRFDPNDLQPPSYYCKKKTR